MSSYFHVELLFEAGSDADLAKFYPRVLEGRPTVLIDPPPVGGGGSSRLRVLFLADDPTRRRILEKLAKDCGLSLVAFREFEGE